MADGGRTFTETEHFALLTDAVGRETATLAEVKDTLEATVSTLTAENAAEKTAHETATSELQSWIDVLKAGPPLAPAHGSANRKRWPGRATR